ncbi:MAG: D-alanine--D-alanine ligase [Lachnospiraceae bacterium]|nr:D-alanine--D-alanine ligase [Lachnospiraceae bacterium]
MKIVVLCGGTSTERAVSLVTGSDVCRALRSKGHKAILIDVFLGHKDIDVEKIFDEEFSVDEELKYIEENSKDFDNIKKKRRNFFGENVLELCKACDIVFMGLHGACGEDGKVQAALELMGVKYTGANALSSAMAMDKAVTKKIFAADNVPMAKGFKVSKDTAEKMPESYGLKYPVVVKPNCGGSSIGVYFAENSQEYEDALERAFAYEDVLVVEEKITGREFSIGVVEYEAYPIIEIIPNEGFYDYENKYKPGATKDVCPAEVDEESAVRMQKAAVDAAKSLGLDTYCRVDVLMDKEGNCYCLEANTLPGMTPTSLLPQEAKVIGLDYAELCEHLINISLNK